MLRRTSAGGSELTKSRWKRIRLLLSYWTSNWAPYPASNFSLLLPLRNTHRAENTLVQYFCTPFLLLFSTIPPPLCRHFSTHNRRAPLYFRCMLYNVLLDVFASRYRSIPTLYFKFVQTLRKAVSDLIMS